MAKTKIILTLCLVLSLLLLSSLVSCGEVSVPSLASSETGDTVNDVQYSDSSSVMGDLESSDSSSVTEDTFDNTETTDSTETQPSTPPSDDTDEGEALLCYFAEISTNNRVVVKPYTGYGDVPTELKGQFYSALTPGGLPKNDGTGSIWMTLTPHGSYCVDSIEIEGEYEGLELVENDLYRISGVRSDLKITVTTVTLPSTQREIFGNYGYGISEGGILTVTWEENTEDPIRYVEIGYTDTNGENVKKYVDASKGKAELFQMKEAKIYTVDMRAIGYYERGKTVTVTGCYMDAPRDVSFPRVEITTENFMWPSCDFVSSPEGCWGAGITNAFYEQCIVTVYNKDNEVVFNSSNEIADEYSGAKMKIRGNTSARYASHSRYPYKIKLDKSADLLYPLIGRADDGKAYADKDWLLLNYGSDGYRICGDAVADAVGTEWSPDYCYVSLYVNGEYRGLYVLSEAVEEGNGQGEEQWRVAVDDDGYVFECDAYWWNEDLYFRTPLSANTPMYFTFKYPDPDDMNENSAELLYLKDYITRFEEALMKNDDSYLEYIDLDSFVRWLLVADYLSIEDGGGCNLFLYKKDSTDETKIAMGPNWDFDSYMGGVQSLSVIRMSWNGAPFYYQYLIKKESFQKRYCELFGETYKELEAYIEAAFAEIDMSAHNQLLAYDNQRFGTSTTSLLTRKERFLSFLSEHIEWMKTQFK